MIVGCFIVSETAFVTFNYSFTRQAKLAVQPYVHESCRCRRRRCCGDEKFPPIYSVIPLKLPSFARADTLVVQVYSSPFLLSPLFLHIRTIPTCTWCSSSYPAGRCSATSGAWESLGSDRGGSPSLLQLREREKERERARKATKEAGHSLARSFGMSLRRSLSNQQHLQVFLLEGETAPSCFPQSKRVIHDQVKATCLAGLPSLN